MARANLDLRNALKAAGLKQWQVAEALQIRESNLSIMLRHELDQETKSRILGVVKTLVREVV